MSSVHSSESTKTRNYLPLIFFIFALPLLASFAVYNLSAAIDLKTKNVGDLLTIPVPLNSLNLLDREGNPFLQDAMQGRWILIYLADANCSDQCMKDLSALEKVRRALGKDYRRTELLLLQRLGPNTELTKSTWQFPTALIDDGHRKKLDAVPGPLVFLADDHQNVMMRYAGPIDQQATYDDLRWLLKVNKGTF